MILKTFFNLFLQCGVKFKKDNMHREIEMSYDEKIKMYLKHSKEDLAKMLIEANRTLDLLTNNEWFLGQHDPGGGLKRKYEEGFVEYAIGFCIGYIKFLFWLGWYSTFGRKF